MYATFIPCALLEAAGAAVTGATAITRAAGTAYRGGHPGIVDAEAGEGRELTSGGFMAVRAGDLFISPT